MPEIIQAFVAAAVALFGLLWLAWPRFGTLVPGGLILDERVATHLGLSSDALSRVRDAGGISGPRDIAEARILGFALAFIGISALFSHTSAMVLLVAVVVVDYSAVLTSAGAKRLSARALRPSAERRGRFTVDNVTMVAMLGPIGNAVILVAAPYFTARCLAILVGAVVAIVAYVYAVTNLSAAASPLERALAARRRSALSFTAIAAANLVAFAYGTLVLDVGNGFAVALTGWGAVSTALLVYYARKRFSALNEALQSALK
jgi:hypothetical protein